MSPIDTLRAAATRLREAATAATPGPWIPLSTGDGWDIHAPSRFVGLINSELTAKSDGGLEDATYIALTHPGVALAVADWLATVARLHDVGDSGGPLNLRHALAVAHAILGADA